MAKDGAVTRMQVAKARLLGKVLGYETNGNVSKACKKLGISRDQAHKMIRHEVLGQEVSEAEKLWARRKEFEEADKRAKELRGVSQEYEEDD